METENKQSKSLLIVLIVVAVAGAGMALYFYNDARMLRQDPQRVAREQAVAIAKEVSKLVVLPQDEIPTVATVTNPDALKAQAFFAQAKIGDKVLIYATAKRAVLYDPIAKKVLEVTSITGNIPAPSVDKGTTAAEEKKATESATTDKKKATDETAQ